MKTCPKSPIRSAGFTLIELMVTMAILSIILGMALQVTESARNSIRISESKSIGDAIARKAMDQFKRDISQILTRPDARIEFKSQPGNDKLAFLAKTRGLTSSADVGERGVSLVTYELIDDATQGKLLQRGSRGHQFDDAAADALALDPDKPFPTIATNNLQSISRGVIRMEMEYLISGATGVTREIVAPLVSENLKGIVVTIATLDDRGRRVIRPDRIAALSANFTDAKTSENTLEAWTRIRDELASAGGQALPKEALQSIRCYQRTFLIP